MKEEDLPDGYYEKIDPDTGEITYIYRKEGGVIISSSPIDIAAFEKDIEKLINELR